MSKINTTLVLTVVFLIFQSSIAQSTDLYTDNQAANKEKIEMAVNNYKNALESDNLGMTESAILNILKLKYYYPDYDYSSLIEPLESLETNAENKTIRIMSYIVKNYLTYPERYAWIDKVHDEFDKDFHMIIADLVSAQVSK